MTFTSLVLGSGGKYSMNYSFLYSLKKTPLRMKKLEGEHFFAVYTI